MTELKEIIRSFLEKKGAHDFIITDLLTTNNGINKISIQLNSASVENFEIISLFENLGKVQKYIPTKFYKTLSKIFMEKSENIYGAWKSYWSCL